MATGPSGFVERYKGKIAAPVGGIYIGGTQVSTTAADQNTGVGTGTVFTSTGSASTVPYTPTTVSQGFGVKQLQPTSTQPIFRMQPPKQGGGYTIVNYSTINGSTGLILTASTDGSVTFQTGGSTGSTASFFGTGGSSISFVIKSTQSHQIEMVSLSSVAWLILSVAPSSVGALTFSTSS